MGILRKHLFQIEKINLTLCFFCFFLSRKQNHPGIARSDECFGDDLDATACSALHKKNLSETNEKIWIHCKLFVSLKNVFLTCHEMHSLCPSF